MSETDGTKIKDGKTITYTGLFINLFLIALKFITGLAGHSQALVADAVHSVSDIFTDVVVLFGLYVGRRPPDKDHHFGHGRLETMASVIVGIILFITAVYLGIKAARNVYFHNEYYPTGLALWGAGLSILVKEILYQYTIRTGRKIKSNIIIANAWHHRSDALSSVAVLIGVAGSMIKPEWHVLDAYVTLLVSFFILKVAIDIIKSSLLEISDAAPPQEITEKIKSCSIGVEGVLGVYDLRIRSLGGLYQIEINIVVNGNLTVSQGHHISEKVEECLIEEVEDIEKIIVHVDPSVEYIF